MNDTTRRDRIWWMAFGYFVSYIPYSLLTKAVTSGKLPGQTSLPTGLQILPLSMIATALLFPLIIGALGWWKYASHTTIRGISLPVPGRITFPSGVAFAVIIGATTLAYTFRGISIVFALLLMRGGVLMIAPIVDVFHHRRVRWYSWVALGLSFVALAIAFANVGGYTMTLAALLNLAAYLSGYVFRLRYMTVLAKIPDPALGRRYLVEESIGASVGLVAIPVVFALLTPGEAGAQLRYGLTTIFTTGFAVPALLIGALYSALGIFGTAVYLNPRENTFAIPVNRCASLLSGVVASWASSLVLGSASPAAAELQAAAVIVVAIFVLSSSTVLEMNKAPEPGLKLSERLFVFVCAGNTSRSPMAEAICNAELARRIAAQSGWVAPIRAESAGLKVDAGAPATALARTTIQQMGMPPLNHTATQLTRAMVRKAEVVFCMTESQRASVIRSFPESAWKTFRLDTGGDIEDPSKHGPEVYARVAAQIKACIDLHLESIGLPGARAASA